MKTVRRGHWLYEGEVAKPVNIVALDYDFWYEIGSADGQLEANETPQQMGPDGVLYYVRFQNAGNDESPTWVDSEGHVTLNDAVAAAESRVPGPISWDSPRTPSSCYPPGRKP